MRDGGGRDAAGPEAAALGPLPEDRDELLVDDFQLRVQEEGPRGHARLAVLAAPGLWELLRLRDQGAVPLHVAVLLEHGRGGGGGGDQIMTGRGSVGISGISKAFHRIAEKYFDVYFCRYSIVSAFSVPEAWF